MALAEMEIIETKNLPAETPQPSDSSKNLDSPDYYYDFDLTWHPSLPSVIDRLIAFTGYCTSTSQSRPGRCLVLAGESGSGKTHLINLIAHYARIHSHSVNEDSLFDRLRSYYSLKRDTTQIFKECYQAELLIYDDLGVPPGNEGWVDDIYYKLFSTTQAYLITTNKPLPEFIKRVGPRAWSRLIGAMGGKKGLNTHFIDMFDVPDYRAR